MYGIIFVSLKGLLSIDVGNNYLKHKNPYKAMKVEKRMLQGRSGATVLHVGEWELLVYDMIPKKARLRQNLNWKRLKESDQTGSNQQDCKNT